MPLMRDVDGIASGSGDRADERAVIAQDGVNERRFADVRSADDGNGERPLRVTALLRAGGSARKQSLDRGDEFRGAAIVFRADRKFGREAELTEFGGVWAVLVDIDFVDDEEDWPAGPSQPARELRIDRHETFLPIDEE